MARTRSDLAAHEMAARVWHYQLIDLLLRNICGDDAPLEPVSD